MENTSKAINFESSGTATFSTSISLWSMPERIDVVELNDKVEFIYKEKSNSLSVGYPTIPPWERVFKIVFSCVDGKWNKSERIYGTIVPPQSEGYKF